MNAGIIELLDRIPDEQVIRDRIAENYREAALLKSLLRTAKKKAAAKQATRPQASSSDKGVSHAG